jgi:hypothetical protein
MKRLVIFSSTAAATEDQRLAALANLMGVRTEILRVDYEFNVPDLLTKLRSGTSSLALHVLTLRDIHRASQPGASFQQSLGQDVKEILIYGVHSANGAEDVDKALFEETDGVVVRSGMRVSPPYVCAFDERTKALCAQLHGQTFPVGNGSAIPVLAVRTDQKPADVIMTANEHPVFVRVRGARELFVSSPPMPQIDKAVSRDTDLDDDYPSLLPPLIFLRHCFPEECWYSVDPTARLIIDDPLLKKRYGGLDFGNLKDSMRRLGYGTSIAFIPWNYWRTSRRTANRLLNDDSNLSICVHGCDHTNREFASGGARVLTEKASVGMRRMAAHRERIGRPFEDVMVFPQGHFAKASLPALRSADFIAAVNSTCFPTDSNPGDLTVADLLWPAVDRFGGFPVFARRYPNNAFGSAVDLFLGKPALLVEHHEYFYDRCKAIEAFVTTLQRIEAQLSWPDLTTLLMRSHVRRTVGNTTELRFFTRRFQIVPRPGDASHYRLIKFEPDPTAVVRVDVDGRSVSFGTQNGFIGLEIEAEPQQIRTLEVFYAAEPSQTIHAFGVAHHAGVLVRRGLSEFRDNTLSRHQRLLKVAKTLAKAMKATAES